MWSISKRIPSIRLIENSTIEIASHRAFNKSYYRRILVQLQKQFSVYSKTKRTVIVKMFITRRNYMRYFEHLRNCIRIFFVEENFEFEIFYK